MVHAEPFGEQQTMGSDHIVVVVGWKLRVQSVTGLRGFPVSDAVRQDHEILGRVEGLATTKKLASKLRREKLRAGAAGPVKDQNSVRHASVGVANWSADPAVMQPEIRQRLARHEHAITGHR